MKQVEVYERISIILNKAKNGPFTWEDISRKLEEFYYIKGIEKAVTQRTFQRDLIEIREIHGIEIRYNKRIKKYEIVEEESSRIKLGMLSTFDLMNSFHLHKGLDEYVAFDGRKAGGTEYLYGIVYAIQNSLTILIDYQSFQTLSTQTSEIKPLVLKEFKNRWYLVGINDKEEIRPYPLDRVSKFEINKKKWDKVYFDIQEYYDEVFGISNESDKSTEEIELHFGILKGKYIKSLPLHKSQKILSDDAAGLRIKLKVRINYDLISELLSHGDEVKVIKPQVLKELIFERAKNITEGILR